MIKNVFDIIFSMDNLYLALEDASRGRRYQKDVLQFNDDAGKFLRELRDEVYRGTYRIEKYHVFYVYEPKKRMIMSIAFKHRVIQWAIYRIINPLFTKGYIEDSYTAASMGAARLRQCSGSSTGSARQAARAARGTF